MSTDKKVDQAEMGNKELTLAGQGLGKLTMRHKRVARCRIEMRKWVTRVSINLFFFFVCDIDI